MKEIKVKFGPANTAILSFPDSATAGVVASDPRIRASLRSPENPRLVLNDVEVDSSTPLDDGDTLVLENRAGTKGS